MLLFRPVAAFYFAVVSVSNKLAVASTFSGGVLEKRGQLPFAV